jgi:TPR repeat protein
MTALGRKIRMALSIGITLTVGLGYFDPAESQNTDSDIMSVFEHIQKHDYKSLVADADKGNMLAEFFLAGMYHSGDRFVQKDDAIARTWFRRAAEQGLPQAEAALGEMYYNGWGGRKDGVAAREWFLKAAEQGDVNAQVNLGTICLYDNPKDYTEARKWFLKAAEKGDVNAQVNLAAIYYKALGVPADYSEARNWYLKAAEHGNAVAQGMLGVIYSQGQGVPRDEAEAHKWLLKAAAQGVTPAEFVVGCMYAGGIGVARDRREAHKWLLKAAQQGYAKAKNLLKDWDTSDTAASSQPRDVCLSSCAWSANICASSNETNSFAGYSVFGLNMTGFAAGHMFNSDCSVQRQACMRRCQ